MDIDTSSYCTSPLDTKETWVRYVEKELELFADEAKEDEVRQHACLYLRRDPHTYKPFEKPLLALLAHEGFRGTDEEVEGQKNRWVSLVRAHALAGDAIAAIHVFEAWVVQADKVPLDVQPCNHPDRQDALFIEASHIDFGPSFHTTILRKDNGQRLVEPWNSHWDAKEYALSGRMLGFLPPPEIRNSTIYDTLCKVATMYIDRHCEEIVVEPDDSPKN